MYVVVALATFGALCVLARWLRHFAEANSGGPAPKRYSRPPVVYDVREFE